MFAKSMGSRFSHPSILPAWVSCFPRRSISLGSLHEGRLRLRRALSERQESTYWGQAVVSRSFSARSTARKWEERKSRNSRAGLECARCRSTNALVKLGALSYCTKHAEYIRQKNRIAQQRRTEKSKAGEICAGCRKKEDLTKKRCLHWCQRCIQFQSKKLSNKAERSRAGIECNNCHEKVHLVKLAKLHYCNKHVECARRRWRRKLEKSRAGHVCGACANTKDLVKAKHLYWCKRHWLIKKELSRRASRACCEDESAFAYRVSMSLAQRNRMLQGNLTAEAAKAMWRALLLKPACECCGHDVLKRAKAGIWQATPHRPNPRKNYETQTVQLYCCGCNRLAWDFDEAGQRFIRHVVRTARAPLPVGHFLGADKNAAYRTPHDAAYILEGRAEPPMHIKHLIRAKYHDMRKHSGCSVSVQELYNLWWLSGDVCNLSGAEVCWGHTGHPFGASFDRIVPGSKGGRYEIRNLQIVSFVGQMVKMGDTVEESLEYFRHQRSLRNMELEMSEGQPLWTYSRKALRPQNTVGGKSSRSSLGDSTERSAAGNKITHQTQGRHGKASGVLGRDAWIAGRMERSLFRFDIEDFYALFKRR